MNTKQINRGWCAFLFPIRVLALFRRRPAEFIYPPASLSPSENNQLKVEWQVIAGNQVISPVLPIYRPLICGQTMCGYAGGSNRLLSIPSDSVIRAVFLLPLSLVLLFLRFLGNAFILATTPLLAQ